MTPRPRRSGSTAFGEPATAYGSFVGYVVAPSLSTCGLELAEGQKVKLKEYCSINWLSHRIDAIARLVAFFN